VLFLSIIAGITAFLFGAPMFGYWLGGVWITHALTNYGELSAFWARRYGAKGGVAASIRAEKSSSSAITAEGCMRGIVAEFNAISRMRRRMIVFNIALALFWYWVSQETSDWLFLFFIAGMGIAAMFYPRRGPDAILGKLFRNVRLWMDADPGSLSQYAGQLHVNGIVMVLQEKEPNETAQPAFGT
jgi:hypothetical protein